MPESLLIGLRLDFVAQEERKINRILFVPVVQLENPAFNRAMWGQNPPGTFYERKVMMEEMLEKAMGQERVTLCGGFCCRLTPREMNKWHEYTAALPEYIECALASEEYDFSKRIAVEFPRASFDRTNSAREKMYEIGKSWYAELLQKRDEKRE